MSSGVSLCNSSNQEGGMEVGDYVRCRPLYYDRYGVTNEQMICGVVECFCSHTPAHMTVRVLGHTNEAYVGRQFVVVAAYFEVISRAVPALDFTIHEYRACADCGKYFDATVHVDTVCPECRRDDYYRCGDCGDWIHSSDVNWVGSGTVCDTCIDRRYVYCDACGEWVCVDEACRHNDMNYCQSCYDDRYIDCDHCGSAVHRDDVLYRNGNALCCDCASECDEDDEDDYDNRKLHGHWAKLRSRFHDNRCDVNYQAIPNMLYFGMELEMEVPNGSRRDVVDEIYNEGEDNWYLEEDGSLNNGIEVVTHPRTFDSWQKFWPEFDDRVLGPARHAKCTAHDSGTCGIHIHTSLDAWREDQLLRLFALLYNKKSREGLLTISQRRLVKLNQWASLDIKDISKSKMYRDVLDKISPFRERYAALNITSRTLEVRLFNSSLRLDRVQKNMEFVLALYRYTAEKSRVSWSGFMRWIERNKECLPNLYGFLREKSLLGVQEAATSVEAIKIDEDIQEELCA